MIDLRSDYLETVKRILAQHVPECEVLAFGSRVSGKAKEFSDLDLVIMTESPLSLRKLARLREAFSDSNLPIKVDVVDWATTDASFREIIRRATEIVQSHPAPPPGDYRQRIPLLFSVVFALSTLLHMMLMYGVRLYPFIDLPNHLAAATILRYHDGANLFDQFYHVRPLIGPNILYLVFTSLPIWPSVEIANKLFYIIYVLLFPLSVLMVLRRLGGNVWFALLAFPLMYHFSVQSGFVGYTIAVPLVMLLIAFALDWFRKPSTLSGAAVAVLLLLIFWAHGITGQFAPALFMLLALTLHFRQPRKLLADVMLILPAVALDLYWWNVARDSSGVTSLTAFLWDYYRHSFLQDYARRKALLTFSNYALLEGPAGNVIPILFSGLIVYLSLFMTSSRWRQVWDRRREIGVATTLLFLLFSCLCYALLPGELADSNYLFERMAVFVFFGIIMLGSLMHVSRVQKAKIVIIIMAALLHFGLWADYMRDFRRDSADFTPGLFSGVGSNHTLGGLMAQDTFRGWEAYRHFPNYFIVWNQGIASTRLVDYPMTYVERKVSRQTLPAYSEWTSKWGRYDGRYNHMDYLLLRSDMPAEDQATLAGFKTVTKSGRWTLLAKMEEGK